MKLPDDTLIDEEKLTKYLLVFKKKNDKSKWLSKAGYTSENWGTLENDLRGLLSSEAEHLETTKYGDLYEIREDMTGPNERKLSVVTIWMTENATGITKFITMYPDKRR